LKAQIFENGSVKVLRSDEYNYNFNKKTGYFERWGKTLEDDPQYSPFGPEIADIEIVSGKCSGKCSFCYKCNNVDKDIKYMSLETFKVIFSKLPKTLTQIAFGITDIYANPDFFKIMKYSRDKGVIPNYTMNGNCLDKNAIKLTSELCGAVAVSIVNKENSYNAIKSLTDTGMKQVNCHFMLSEETYKKAFNTIDDIKNDSRLEKLNAIVFLQYKDKNPNAKFHSLLNIDKYKKLIDYCNVNKINYGFDSCSAGIYLESIKEEKNKTQLEQMVDSCESLRMSIYINVDGYAFPCSFCEGTEGWVEGINVLESKDFVKDVWFNDNSKIWRKNLISSMKEKCAKCLIYNLKLEQ
jgi:hypothetical protein